jgi:hypothetical protein
LDDKPKIQLKGIFPGALVRRGENWMYDKEVINYSSFLDGKDICFGF